MNKFLFRCLSLILALLTAFSLMPAVDFTASAAQMTLAQMQKKYPHGKYWNGSDPESYTSTPCTHHSGACSYDGSCGCATYKNYAIQCMGFAFQLAYTAYGGEPYLLWDVEYNADTALKNLKPGDVIRYNYNGHSAFVIGVSGDTVTIADCNYQNNCVIRWGGTITKQKLKESFTSVAKAPYSLAENHKHSYVTDHDSAHPHNEYKKCTACGYYYYTGKQLSSDTCIECTSPGTSGEVIAHPLPIKAIPLSGKTTTAYKSVKGEAKTRKLGGNDICYIREFCDDGWCKIDYIDTKGDQQTGYIEASALLGDPDFAPFKFTATKKVLTYARSDLKEEIGYTVAGDTSYLVAVNDKSAQILYPVAEGSFRAAWVYIDQISLGFTPLWKVNTLTVYYNTGGGEITSKTVEDRHGMIYSKSKDRKITDIWKFNLPKSNGLKNASSFGLKKEGYTFKGWSTTPHGKKLFDQNDKKLLPADINPDITNGSCYTVLYAIWEKKASKVKTLTVTTKPSKTVYKIGEELSTGGLRLTVVYEDGTKKKISKGFTSGIFLNSTAGKKIVPVTYGGKTVYINLTVAKKPSTTKPDSTFIGCAHPKFKLQSTTKATCSALGQKTYKCTTCEGIKVVSVPTLRHTVAVSSKIEPTCKKAGKAEGLYCSVCSEEIEIQSSLPKLSHQYSEKITKRATTKSTGRITKSCATCNYKKVTKIKRIDTLKLSTESYLISRKTRKPYVTVKNTAGKKLKKGVDYTVKYAEGRKSVGKYKVTVTFKGKYKGTRYLYFTIRPKATQLEKLSKRTKGLKIRWTPTDKNTSGYQVEYSTSKTFKEKYTKSVNVIGKTASSLELKNLKGSKKYYIRIRVFKFVKGEKVFSSWSKVKSKKTK